MVMLHTIAVAAGHAADRKVVKVGVASLTSSIVNGLLPWLVRLSWYCRVFPGKALLLVPSELPAVMF